MVNIVVIMSFEMFINVLLNNKDQIKPLFVNTADELFSVIKRPSYINALGSSQNIFLYTSNTKTYQHIKYKENEVTLVNHLECFLKVLLNC